MDITLNNFFWLLFPGLLLALAGYWLGRVAASRQHQQALRHSQEQWQQLSLQRVRLEEQCLNGQASLADKQQQLSDQLLNQQRLQQDNQRLRLEQIELSTRMQEREQQLHQQQQLLQQSKQALSQEFEQLATKILLEKGRVLTHHNQDQLSTLLQPLKEQLTGFQQRVNEVHDASLRTQTDLSAEIKKVLDIGMRMNTEATNLSSALKGDSQQRGAWGEAQLQRTLEMSGLVAGTHFDAQRSFRDADGRHKQTDFVLKLPDNKHIIIDSKVSLVAYDRLVAASPQQADAALAEHLRAVRKHVDDLASKDYTNVIGMRSPSFVLMFMAIEPAYIEALKGSKDLFDYGFAKGVILVSHTTLVPILRTVANLWMLERSNSEAREISDRAGEIYNNVCLLAERLQRLGMGLSAVGNHYNQALTALCGQQGLYGKVERFGQLSAKVSKELPTLEPLIQDLATERLQVIVEPTTSTDSSGQLKS